MTCSHLQISDDKVLLLDTSVIINLHESKFGERILKIFPNKILVTNVIADEHDNFTSRSKGSYSFLAQMLHEGRISCVELNGVEALFMRRIVSSKLDAGETSMISVAKLRFSPVNCIPIIDDKFGQNI